MREIMELCGFKIPLFKEKLILVSSGVTGRLLCMAALLTALTNNAQVHSMRNL